MTSQFSKFLGSDKTVGIVGACFSAYLPVEYHERRVSSASSLTFAHLQGGGQPKGGVDQGPTYLVEFGLVDQLKDLGWKVQVDEKVCAWKAFFVSSGVGICSGVPWDTRYSG